MEEDETIEVDEDRFKRRGYWNKKVETKVKADFEEMKVKKEVMPTKLTQLETLDLFLKGKGIEEIAAARELTVNTVTDHLCFLVEKGLIKDISRLVDKKRQEKILSAIKKVGSDKLTPIKEELGDDFSWEEIKIVRAYSKK